MSVVVSSPQTVIKVSHKGGAVVITKPSSDIVVAPSITIPGTLGLVTGDNVGGGDAEIFRDKIGTVLNFRTLSGLGGISVSENGDVVEIDGSSLQTVLLSHADRHQHGGADEVATATPAANAIPKADGTGKLDTGWMPTGTFTLAAVSSNDTTPGFLNDKLVAGAGLTSSILNPAGDEDLQFNVGANIDGSIVVNADDIQVGILATDAQHGDRGGGSLHTLAVASGAAGFLSGVDKQTIDDLGTTYAPLVHASRHENGGADEIDVTGLSGTLADPQTPATHASTHAGGGSDSITSLGAHSVTGQLELTGTDNVIFLNSTNSNLVSFNTAGAGPPTFTTRSTGTKIVLYPDIGPADVDYAIGTQSGGIWQSVSRSDTFRHFAWYGGQTLLLRLRADGLLQFGGSTNTEVALKRSGLALHVRLADDSGYANLVGEYVSANKSLRAGGTSAIYWLGKSIMLSPQDGNIKLTDNAGTNFGLLQFGGDTNTEPAWKRVGANFQARLADDSDWCTVTAGGFYATELRAGVTGSIYWNTRSRMYSPADGKIKLTNNAGSDFTLLQFGGETASEPAWKKVGATFEARLADDSALTSITASGLTLEAAAPSLIFNDTDATDGYSITCNSNNLTITNDDSNVDGEIILDHIINIRPNPRMPVPSFASEFAMKHEATVNSVGSAVAGYFILADEATVSLSGAYSSYGVIQTRATVTSQSTSGLEAAYVFVNVMDNTATLGNDPVAVHSFDHRPRHFANNIVVGTIPESVALTDWSNLETVGTGQITLDRWVTVQATAFDPFYYRLASSGAGSSVVVNNRVGFEMGDMTKAGGGGTETISNQYGVYLHSFANASTLACGLWFEGATGATNNYGLVLDSDSITGGALWLGDGQDATIAYDGTDLILNSSIVAPSDIVLSCGTDKTLKLTETVWDDLRVPLTAGRLGTTNPPTWSQYRDNGASSVGVYAWAFADQAIAANEEEIWFQVQLPHAWKEGTDVKVHLHWGIKTAGAANEFVKWGLEYTWANIDGTIGTTTIITSDASSAATATTSGDTTLAINKHYTTDIGTITGTGKTISSMLLCRLFRNSSHADDDLAQDAYGFEADLHYEIDTMGSRQTLVK